MSGTKIEQAKQFNSGSATSSMASGSREIAEAALTSVGVVLRSATIPKDQVERQRMYVQDAVNTVAKKEGFDAKPFTDRIYSAVGKSLDATDGADGYKTTLTVTGDRGRKHQLIVYVPTADAMKNGEKVTVYEVKRGTHATSTNNHVL